MTLIYRKGEKRGTEIRGEKGPIMTGENMEAENDGDEMMADKQRGIDETVKGTGMGIDRMRGRAGETMTGGTESMLDQDHQGTENAGLHHMIKKLIEEMVDVDLLHTVHKGEVTIMKKNITEKEMILCLIGNQVITEVNGKDTTVTVQMNTKV